MKTSPKVTILTIAIYFASLGAFASGQNDASEEEYDLPTYEVVDAVSLPKPRRSSTPAVKSRLVGMKLNLRLTVNEKGRPENVRLEKPLTSYSDVEKMSFASQMRESVSKWSFNPARDSDNKPVAVKIIMPVRVVKYGKVYKALASVEFDDDEIRL